MSNGSNWSNGTTSGTTTTEGTSGSSGWSNSSTEGTTSGVNGGIFVINGSSSDSSSTTTGTSGSEGWSQSTAVNNSTTSSVGGSTTNTHGTSNSVTNGSSHSVSTGNTTGTSQSWGSNQSTTQSSGWNESVSQSFGQTTGSSDTVGSTVGTSVGQVNSNSVSHSNGESWGTNSSVGTGESWSTGQGTNWSNGTTHNESVSNTNTMGNSQSQSTGNTSTQTSGTSHSVSHGTTQTDSYTHSTADTTGKSWGTTTGTSQGNSTAQSIGHTVGQALGTSGTITSGSTTSMGIGPAIGYAKSYQWMDQEVKNILTLLDFQNMRLMKALRGNGAFFTDVYIATDSTESLAAASILAKSAWANTEAMICPLQILDLTPEEQNHLIYHFYAFSADNRKEGLGGRMESYRYSTILLSDEFAAYTHLPRISEGGVFADVGDVPKFAVPSMKKGDIYIGKVLSGERWTPTTGYETPFEYRLEESELMHGIFTGESRSGKTVAATRFVSELTKVRRKSGKRLRIVALDPKQDWRILAKFVEPERFHFYSLGNPEFLPIKLNILKVPHNVNPQVWLDGIIEIYCRAYGLMERGKAILAETLYALYDEAGVFEDSPNWREFVPERSAKVTFPKVYERMNQIKLDLEDPLKSGKGRMGNEARDAYTRVLDRMQIFGRKFSIETRLFGQEDGIGVILIAFITMPFAKKPVLITCASAVMALYMLAMGLEIYYDIAYYDWGFQLDVVFKFLAAILYQSSFICFAFEMTTDNRIHVYSRIFDFFIGLDFLDDDFSELIEEISEELNDSEKKHYLNAYEENEALFDENTSRARWINSFDDLTIKTFDVIEIAGSDFLLDPLEESSIVYQIEHTDDGTISVSGEFVHSFSDLQAARILRKKSVLNQTFKDIELEAKADTNIGVDSIEEGDFSIRLKKKNFVISDDDYNTVREYMIRFLETVIVIQNTESIE